MNLVCNNISNGNASRFIKPRWFNDGQILTAAFDLRSEGVSPETYVSHIMTEGECLDDQFLSAYENILKRMKNCRQGGSIAILKVSEALIEVNDESEPFIEFIEKGLPHCGLRYLTDNQQQIQEAKATLCCLARKQHREVTSIQSQMTLTKLND